MKESNFQFANPVINEIYLYINDDFDNDKFDGLDINSKTTVSMLSEGLKAVVSLEVNIGGKENQYPFIIKCRLSSDFKWKEDTENIEELLQKNAPALLLSYARPYISLLTASSKYSAFNLPFMNFQDNKQK